MSAETKLLWTQLAIECWAITSINTGPYHLPFAGDLHRKMNVSMGATTIRNMPIHGHHSIIGATFIAISEVMTVTMEAGTKRDEEEEEAGIIEEANITMVGVEAIGMIINPETTTNVTYTGGTGIAIKGVAINLAISMVQAIGGVIEMTNINEEVVISNSPTQATAITHLHTRDGNDDDNFNSSLGIRDLYFMFDSQK